MRGGYSPDLVRVRQGVPLRVVFDRRESGECTSRVVFPEFAVNQALPAFAQMTVQLVPNRAGEFVSACGMNMVHGTLVVEPSAMAVEPAPGPAPAGSTCDGPSRRAPRKPGGHQWSPGEPVEGGAGGR